MLGEKTALDHAPRPNDKLPQRHRSTQKEAPSSHQRSHERDQILAIMKAKKISGRRTPRLNLLSGLLLWSM